MKITNYTVGWIICLVLVIICHYWAYSNWGELNGNGFPTGASFFSCFLVSLSWLVFCMMLFSGEIKFSFKVPVPFKKYRAAMKERKELNEAIKERYIAMAKAKEGKEFNQIHDEVLALESRL